MDKSFLGQFNLDPNRVIDVILDCFENNIGNRDLYLNTLKKFKINREELGNILLLKFVFCAVKIKNKFDIIIII